MDFHLIDIKTGETEKEVALTGDDDCLKEIDMKIKNQSKGEKAE